MATTKIFSVSNAIDSLKQTARSGKFTRSDIAFCGLATEQELTVAINAGAVEFNAAGILVLVQPVEAVQVAPSITEPEPRPARKSTITDQMLCHIDPSDPFGFDEEVVVRPGEQWEYIAKGFPLLKLRNADRAHKDGYLLLTGEREAVRLAAEELGQTGVAVVSKQNGYDPNKFKLIIPLYGEGGLMMSEAA